MNYTPLPYDQFVRDGVTLTVERVFPSQVVFSFSNGSGPHTVSREEFDRKAVGSVQKGAVILRNGEQIIPEPVIETPEPDPVPQPAPEPDPVPQPAQPTPPVTIQSGSHNTHARLSPSDSKRWVNCTLSIAFQEANAHRIPPDRSFYADEGTEAHDWAAKLLTNEVTADGIPGQFREYVAAYADACKTHVPGAVLTHLDSCIEDAELGLDPPERAFFVEEQIPLFYQPTQRGTADFLALHAEGGVVQKIYGDDYKHGAGVLVDTEDNTQLAIYIFSAIARLQSAYTFTDDTVVEITIHQPRHREAAEQKPWVIRLGDLRVIAEEIAEKAAIARECAEAVRIKIDTPGKDVSCDDIAAAAPQGCFAPGEGDSGACRWCKCKAFCSARMAANTEGMDIPSMPAEAMLAAMPDLTKADAKLPAAERLGLVSEVLGAKGHIITDEYLIAVVAKKKAITSFLNDAEEYLESRLLAGEEIPGVKLVEGREGNRDWADPDAAESFLKNQGLKMEERYTYKLKSPAQIESAIKEKLKKTRTRNRFEELIVRSPAKKKIAISEDSRDAVSPNVAAMPVVEEFEV